MRGVALTAMVLFISGAAGAGWDFITLQEWLVTMVPAAHDDLAVLVCGLPGKDSRVAVLRQARAAGVDVSGQYARLYPKADCRGLAESPRR